MNKPFTFEHLTACEKAMDEMAEIRRMLDCGPNEDVVAALQNVLADYQFLMSKFDERKAA